MVATKRILRTPEAARYIGLSPSTLEKLRLTSKGPQFVRLTGRAVGYDIRALDDWVEDHSRGTEAGPSSADDPDPVVNQP